jgi:hypothetical protein
MKQNAIVKTLLPDLNIKNEAGCTVLIQALRSLATLSRSRGPSYLKSVKDSIMTSLQLMADRGADGGVHDRDGNTALHRLIGYSEQGFDVNFLDHRYWLDAHYYGRIPLPVAILYELRTRLKCLRLLIRAGCDPVLALSSSHLIGPVDKMRITPATSDKMRISYRHRHRHRAGV